VREQNDSNDEVLGAFVERLQAMPVSDPRARAAILARVRGRRQAPWRATLAWAWQPSVSLLAAAAVVVAALGAGYAGGVLVTPAASTDEIATTTIPVVAVSNVQSSDSLVPVQFVLPAKGATQVALVGDFNGWDAQMTALKDPTRSGVWEVTLLLPPGRHTYAFLVNDTTWKVDPRAQTETDPDFGRARSVILVGTER
jgi:hypothetical protein